MTRSVGIIDTTLRDGQQSLWACRMRTADMLPIIGLLDRAGYAAIEFTIPSIFFARAINEYGDNPWDWISLGTKAAGTTELRLHGGAGSWWKPVPIEAQLMLLRRMRTYGIDVTRTSSPWNDAGELQAKQEVLASEGLKMVANLIYAVSPRHTHEYYRQRVQDIIAISPARICFKDVGGLLTPETALPLLKMIREETDGLEIEFHAHCSNGFGPYVTLLAAEAGFDFVHTSLPPLANGSCQPSVFDVVPNLRARGFDVNINLAQLSVASEHLFEVARSRDLPVSGLAVYRDDQYAHQIPGGMLSNLEFQLEQIGKIEALPQAIAETARVRKDLGYPIMVTPFAQFVGTQAVLNVISESAYGTVSDEIIRYTLGHYGQEALAVIPDEIRVRIIDRPRAREIILEAEASSVQPVERGRVMIYPTDPDEIETYLAREIAGLPESQAIPAPASGPDDYPQTPEEYRARGSSAVVTEVISLLDGFEGGSIITRNGRREIEIG